MIDRIFLLLLFLFPIFLLTFCASSGQGDGGFVDPLGDRLAGKKSTTSVLATLDTRKIDEMIRSGELKGNGAGIGKSAAGMSALSKLNSAQLSKRSSLAKFSSAQLSNKKMQTSAQSDAPPSKFPPTSSSADIGKPAEKTNYILNNQPNSSLASSSKLAASLAAFKNININKSGGNNNSNGGNGSVYIVAENLEPRTRSKIAATYQLLASQGSISNAKTVQIFKTLQQNASQQITAASTNNDYDHIFAPAGQYLVSIFVNSQLLCSTYTFLDGGFHVRGLKNRGCRPLPEWEDAFDVIVQKVENMDNARTICHYATYQQFKNIQEARNFDGLVPTKIIDFYSL